MIGTALGTAVAGALLGPALGAVAASVGTGPVFGSVLVVALLLAFAASRLPEDAGAGAPDPARGAADDAEPADPRRRRSSSPCPR